VSPQQETILNKLLDVLSQSVWDKWDFRLSLLLAILSVLFSVLAYFEARRAKHAAQQAATTVKLQTVTIELSEIMQKLDSLDFNISFPTARDLLNEMTRKLRRLTSPYRGDNLFNENINKLRGVLDQTKVALNDARPVNPESTALNPNAIYYAIQAYFADISGVVADLMGLFEQKAIYFGDKHEPSRKNSKISAGINQKN
jgi:hypothetical protein